MKSRSLAGHEEGGLRLCGTTMAEWVRTAHRMAHAYSPVGPALCVSHTVKFSRDVPILTYSFKIFIYFVLFTAYVCLCACMSWRLCRGHGQFVATVLFYFIFSFYHTDAGNAPQATRSGPSPAEPSHLLPHIFRPVPTNSRTGRNSEHILAYKSCVLSSKAF